MGVLIMNGVTNYPNFTKLTQEQADRVYNLMMYGPKSDLTDLRRRVEASAAQIIADKENAGKSK